MEEVVELEKSLVSFNLENPPGNEKPIAFL